MIALLVVIVGYHMVPKSNQVHITLYSSKTLPQRTTEVFMGRDEELRNLDSLIDFRNTTAIISITGPPGSGKSTLAMHAGYQAKKIGVSVYYVDLGGVSNVQIMYQDLLYSIKHEENQVYNDTQEWTQALQNDTVFIFDNCDSILQFFKEDFQRFLKRLIQTSEHLKVLMTAQLVTKFTSHYEEVPIAGLKTRDAANILMKIKNISDGDAVQIAELVERVPLALQVVGALLKEQSTHTVIKALKTSLLHTLIPEELPWEERVLTILKISYQYLKPRFQGCGQVLANLNGSFLDTTAHKILSFIRNLEWSKLPDSWKNLDAKECLRVLRLRSLLSVNWHTNRYNFHGLIQTFFKFMQLQSDSKKSQVRTFFYTTFAFELAHKHHFGECFQSFIDEVQTGTLTPSDSAHDHYVALHEDRHHFDYKYDIIDHVIIKTSSSSSRST